MRETGGGMSEPMFAVRCAAELVAIGNGRVGRLAAGSTRSRVTRNEHHAFHAAIARVAFNPYQALA